MEKEKLKKVKRLLIVVDMINGFITEGVLHDAYIDTITPEIARLLQEEFVEETDEVLFANDEHDENAVEFDRFGKTKHAVKGTYEAEIIDKLKPLAQGKWKIGKNSTSLYVKEEFRNALNEMEELEEIVIVGCCTDQCIMNLAIPLKNHFEEQNKRVRIVAPINATETFEIPGHKRGEWNHWARKFTNQAGIETPKTYVKRRVA